MEATVRDSPYLTYGEAADYCRVNRSTLWRAVKQGSLRASGPGTAVRFRRDELDAWMGGRSGKQKQPLRSAARKEAGMD
jgi:excisionase family DNA binding protein